MILQSPEDESFSSIKPACSLRIYKASLSSFLAATLHIAFTETLANFVIYIHFREPVTY